MAQRFWLIAALFVLQNIPVSAQKFEFLPEVDTYFKVVPNVRLYFQAKQTREGGEPTQGD